MLNVFVKPEAAGAMMDLSDDEIVAKVLPDIERFFPGATATKRFAQIVRWPNALPKSPVGRSRDLAEYRKSRPSSRRVLLAGDYMGLPHFESAIETGTMVRRSDNRQRRPAGARLHIVDDRFAELRALQQLRAGHQALEVVGHFFLAIVFSSPRMMPSATSCHPMCSNISTPDRITEPGLTLS